MLNTPVVFLIFRRPDLTAQVFEAIRQAKPKKLFVVADGPRNESEKILCQQARAVTEDIDWDCEVVRNYADENLGCRKRVSSGLDWLFEQVEEAIILEDDCLPSSDFFFFCQELLEYYRNDMRIWSICGHNFQDGQWRGDGSYYFSRYPDPWGWATWRRCWQQYDRNLKDWPDFYDRSLFGEMVENPLEVEHWTNIFSNLHKNDEIDANVWDYRWIFTCLKNGSLSIWPNVNLVSNIGFREDSTHCKVENRWSNLSLNHLQDIKHPKFILRNKEADNYYFNHRQDGLLLLEKKKQNKFPRSILTQSQKAFTRILTKLKKVVKNILNR
jgi:hypothetical protein